MTVSRVIENWEWRWVFISSALLLILLVIPFVWAYGVAAPDSHFMGVLVNPIDGASYQAKMQEGWNGGWFFTLPYTPEQHEGVFLFTFYLGMGHLARLFDTEPILIFHVVRLIGALMMMLAAYRLIADWTDDVPQRRVSWSLMMLGAGFGWVALAFGYIASDVLLLPEAFPFQAAYANPHFPWAITAVLLIAHILLIKAIDPDGGQPDFDAETAGLVAATLILVSASPFALAPVGVGYGMLLLWLWRQRQAFPLRQLYWGCVVLIFGLPLAAYNAWAISARNPVFAAWMAQNITPSPPIWDYLVAFGPLLALAGVGVWASLKLFDEGDAFLLGWVIGGLLLLYAPIGLQRRFSMGLIIPLAIYGGRGIWRVLMPRFARRRPLLGMIAIFVLFLPTTIVALVLPMLASLQAIGDMHGDHYFINAEERQTFEWLEQNAPQSLVLASPDTSLFLPVYSLRVVYGHPFETLNPDRRLAEVEGFYSGEDCAVLDQEQVDYLIVGPREQALTDISGGEMCPIDGQPVFTSATGQVAVYDVDRP